MSVLTAPVPGQPRRTKVVATVGPASNDPAVLARLVAAGVDVFRLNLSHGDHDWHRIAFHRIRQAAAEAGRHLAVLADLCGPKLRVGRFSSGQVRLDPGQHVTVTTRDVLGGPGVIPTQYAGLPGDVHPGDRILLDDGLLELRVEQAAGTEVHATVVVGGVLRDRKGMNLPGVNVSAPTLTDKDRQDTRFAVELGVDYLALSFVRRPGDVLDLRQLVTELGHDTPIIAKIEKPAALETPETLDEILDAADGIMVARGDLGVELPPETVPIIQQELVARTRTENKPVIVATQMLESMVHSPQATRAEVSDVSTAVLGGADAVMLSAETSVGEYPVQAAEMLARVARRVETWQSQQDQFRSLAPAPATDPGPLPLRVAVSHSTAQLARELGVQAVVVRSREGTSARVIAASRPAAPVVAMSPNASVCRRLSLFWGVLPCLIGPEDFDQPAGAARRLVRELGLAKVGDVILLVAGFGRKEPTITVLPV
jgi:pyruvate kinase